MLGSQAFPPATGDSRKKLVQILVVELFAVPRVQFIKTFTHKRTGLLQLGLTALKQSHRLAQRIFRRRETAGFHGPGDKRLMIASELNFHTTSVTQTLSLPPRFELNVPSPILPHASPRNAPQYKIVPPASSHV